MTRRKLERLKAELAQARRSPQKAKTTPGTTMKEATEMEPGKMAPADYLRKPYGRLVVPEPDGSFHAEILEFPGCIAIGDTAQEALSALEEVATSWLEIALSKGQQIPEPMESTEFSGKTVLRLPRSLHRKAAHAAKREGVSLNQLIVSCVAEHVGAHTASSVRAQHVTNVFVSGEMFIGSSGSPSGRLSTHPSIRKTAAFHRVLSAPELA